MSRMDQEAPPAQPKHGRQCRAGTFIVTYDAASDSWLDAFGRRWAWRSDSKIWWSTPTPTPGKPPPPAPSVNPPPRGDSQPSASGAPFGRDDL